MKTLVMMRSSLRTVPIRTAISGISRGRCRKLLPSIVTAIAVMAGSDSAQATEAAAGRYVPGAFAAPGAGIVPPMPGLFWAISNVYYHGEASGEIPFGDNSIAAGLQADMWVSALGFLYVPKWDLPGNWTFAVQGAVPVGWTGTEAEVGNLEASDDMSGLGDIVAGPLLGWHNDTFDTFVSTSLMVTAPTGAWEEGRLAFVGLNYWTFAPSIAITRLIPQHGLDFSGRFGVDINTTNEDTDYHSGALAHLDLAVTKNVTENLSLGMIAGFLYQFEDDDSDFADTHDGFKGRSTAIGPLVKYKAKFGESTEVDFSLKWAHELDVENRMKGDAVFLDISGKF